MTRISDMITLGSLPATPAYVPVEQPGSTTNYKFDLGTLVTGLLPVFTPQQYGAKGDGVTNDTSAFQAMATAITLAGGGVIELRPVSYLVGRQNLANDGFWMFKPEDVLVLDGLPRGVTIHGNGAKFELPNSYKYGLFNADGTADTTHNGSLPYTTPGKLSSLSGGFTGILTIKNCTGPVKVENLEIDGNLANAVIGGKWGDGDWQIPGDLVMIIDNTGGEEFDNLYVHDSPRDNIQTFRNGSGEAMPRHRTTWTNIHSYRCARNTLTIGGGRGFTFNNSRFHGAGQGAIGSAPSAGCDIEAEASPIRDVVFNNCEFDDTRGVAFISDLSDVEGVTCNNCTFVGVTTAALWPRARGMRFNNCKVVGTITSPYSSTDHRLALAFTDCFFTDDTAHSPTGVIASDSTVLCDFAAHGEGALWERCSFDFGRTRSWSNGDQQVFRDCTITHVTGATLSGGPTNSRFEGRNILDPSTAMAPQNIAGHIGTNPSALLLVGFGEMYKGSKTWDPSSVAGGANTTTTVNVYGVHAGDHLMVGFSKPLQGMTLSGEVTTEGGDFSGGVVTVTLANPTGGAIDLASGTLTVGVIGRGI